MYKTFEEIIKEQKVGNHNSSFGLFSGSFSLEPELLPRFKQLFRPHGTTKNTGNGEVALYWLLDKKYGGAHEVEKNPGNDQADFLVDGQKVEIKGWDLDIFDNQRIKIGRFESLHDLRRIINVVFGAYNVFYSGKYSKDKHGKDSYLSESSFGFNGLTKAFDCSLKIKEINLNHLDNLRSILNSPMFAGLTEPEDFAAKFFAVLAARKLSHKVGRQNFIINARSGKNIGRIDTIKLNDLDVRDCNLDLIKNDGVRVQCSELFVNLCIFKQK